MKEIKERHNLVVKSNNMIQLGKHDLTAAQQKILLYIISKIKPEDTEFQNYEFELQEFCKVAGIYTSGREYADIKAELKIIADKSWYITLPDGRETLVRWLSKVTPNPKNGTITIRLDEDLKPYLLQLHGNFTQYELIWCLRFRKKYSIRLYEFINSIHYRELEEGKWNFTLDRLRETLGAERYIKWNDLKTRALDPAVAEINELSNKLVRYEMVKQGRTVVGIKLYVTSKDAMTALDAAIDAEYYLNKEVQNGGGE